MLCVSVNQKLGCLHQACVPWLCAAAHAAGIGCKWGIKGSNWIYSHTCLPVSAAGISPDVPEAISINATAGTTHSVASYALYESQSHLCSRVQDPWKTQHCFIGSTTEAAAAAGTATWQQQQQQQPMLQPLNCVSRHMLQGKFVQRLLFTTSARHLISAQQQQQPLQQHMRAGSLSHEQQQQQPSPRQQVLNSSFPSADVFVNSVQSIKTPALLELTRAAFEQSSVQRSHLLQKAFREMLRQLETTPRSDIVHLLHCFETSKTPLDMSAVNTLLQHMDKNAQQYDCRTILRVLRSASFSLRAVPSNRRKQQQTPQISRLLGRVWSLAGFRKHNFKPVYVPKFLRSVSVLQAGCQQHKLSPELFNNFVSHWLHGMSRAAVASTTNGHASDAHPSVQEAAMVIRAASCLGLQLGGVNLQRLMEPLLKAAHEACNSSDRCISSSRAAAMGPSRPDVVTAVEACAWLPALLMATNSLDMHDAHCREQHRMALEAASSILSAFAAHASDAGSISGQQTSSREQAAVANSICEVLQILVVIRQAAPLEREHGLVDGLAATLLTVGASIKRWAEFLHNIANLGQCPPAARMTAIRADFYRQLLQHSLQQQQQQQEAAAPSQQHPTKQQWRTHQEMSLLYCSISQFLHACAAMGYTLQDDEQEFLLQLQLRHAPSEHALYDVTQSLSALAHMGVAPCQPRPHSQGALHRGLSDRVASLACQLLTHGILQQTADGGEGHDSGRSNASSSSSQPSKLPFDDFAEDSNRHIGGEPAYQMCLAAWAAAMCDLTACKDTVLDICHMLARPSTWKKLRKAEHVQLVAVHLWLCGNYQWSDTEGLSAIFSKEQMQCMRIQSLLTTHSGTGADAEGSLPHLQKRSEHLREGVQSYIDLLPEEERKHATPVGAGQDNAPTAADNVASYVQSCQGMLSTSVSQKAVWKHLKMLPEVQSAQVEALTDDGLFSVDVLVKTAAGGKVAVEYDGPHHFSVVLPPALPSDAAWQLPGGHDQGGAGKHQVHGLQTSTQADQGAEQHLQKLFCDPVAAPGPPLTAQEQNQDLSAGQQPVAASLRTVLYRNCALTARGYAVVEIPFFNWDRQADSPTRQQYLSGLLDRALSNARSTDSTCADV